MKHGVTGWVGRHGLFAVWVVALTTAPLLVVSNSGCSSGKVAAQGPMMPTVPVTVASAVSKDVPVQVRMIGTAEAFSTVSVRSLVGGEIVSVSFTEGQEVTKGSELFEIDPKPFETDLRRNQANLARDNAALVQAKANLARDTAQAANAAVEKNRYEQLVARGVIAKEQYDQVRTNAEALDAAVRADQAAIDSTSEAIRADSAAVDNARIQLGYCSISSPIDGRTGSLIVHRGNVVKANDAALVVINQVSPIYVSFSVPDSYLPAIRKYMASHKVKVEATPQNDAPSQGELTFVDNAVDTGTGTIRLKAAFKNVERRLWPGQFVNVVVTLQSQPDTVVVPSEAVQSGQSGAFVFVIKPDLRAETRPVKPGRVVGSETVIEKGLQPGERVVTDGQLLLMPGAKVEIKEPVGSKPGSQS